MRQKLIFSINPGRSGSEYLARLLGTAAGVWAFHEDAPQMTGDYLRMINEHPYEHTYAARRFKAEVVKEFLDRHASMSYADSSHMFVKTFHDVLARECEGLEVVLLRRRLAEVLKSFVELSYFDRHRDSLDWMSSPNAATAAIRCIDTDARLEPIDRCIAYLVDIEARALRFRAAYPDVPVHEVTLDELDTPSGVLRLFHALGIEPTPETRSRVGVRINERKHRKATFGVSITLDACEERIDAYLRRARVLGIEPPETLWR